MEIWAAIDLHLGRAVTLAQGEMKRATVWNDDPMEAARRWASEGAYGLHVIDLDAVFDSGSNAQIVKEIVRQSEVRVQLGGGIRSEEDARKSLELGVTRVVLGTLACGEPKTLLRLLDAYGPERVIVAADYREGMLTTKGWTRSEGISIISAVKQFEKAGVGTILVTSVGNDGMATGPDIMTLRRVCESTSAKILGSGGIRNLGDIEELGRVGVHGAVLGRALYEGTIKLAECRKTAVR